MESYKILFENHYLIGDNKDSPISLNGVLKLIQIFEKMYKSISIIIINEYDFFKDFINFKKIVDPYITKYSFIYEKLKYVEYNSLEEDELYSQLKAFIIKFNNYKETSTEYYDEISANYDLLLRLLEFYEKRHEIINNMMCKKILRLEKKKDINFFIWVNEFVEIDKNDKNNHHYSLVVNINNNYIFLDSCSIYFRRWPIKKLISKNNNDGLFISSKTFVMMSFLQNDTYNCVSYCFSFIEIITQLYNKLGGFGLINYLKKYFNFSYEDSFEIEANTLYSDLDGISLYLLPKEILSLVNSDKVLESLRDKIIQMEGINNCNVKMINEILRDRNDINKYRNLHIKYLLENIKD